MFSKSRINETAGRAEAPRASESAASAPVSAPVSRPSLDMGGNVGAGSAPKPKPAASVLSADLQISGNIRTSGDVVIEGVVDGDIRAHLLTVGESATIRGEIIADDIVINGRVIGRVRGLKVRLTSTARVEGDIIHKTIAIESGAHFEGSVQRQDDPLASSSQSAAASATASSAPRPAAAAPQPAAAPAARPSMPAEASRPAAPKAPMDSKASQ
ncbi:polymer-forming cytoskeletal protein [Pararhodobacter sp.]|uniref:bactofilin family protein n=1 Tax=Pararhodobacter sp. TaxID=2127056 RepID=UPI002B00165B|nr:polymer-forming cytoskeletal protein [Pararhodobacter sp.]